MNNLHNFSNGTCISQIFFHEKQKRLYCIWEWSLAKGTRRRVENLHVMLWIIHALILSHVQIIQKMSVNSKTSAPPHVSFSKEKKFVKCIQKFCEFGFLKCLTVISYAIMYSIMKIFFFGKSVLNNMFGNSIED